MVPNILTLALCFGLAAAGTVDKSKQCIPTTPVELNKAFAESLLKLFFVPMGETWKILPDKSSKDEQKWGSKKVCYQGGTSYDGRIDINFWASYDQLNKQYFAVDSADAANPFSYWGTTTFVKTDGKTWILAVHCIAGQQSTWSLINNDPWVGHDSTETVLQEIEKLGFRREDSYGAEGTDFPYRFEQKKC